MDLRKLQALVAVVDHGSFTAAARATHTVQSNVSSHVAQLERELDATLIDRATGTATQEGEAVVQRARAILREIGAIDSDIAAMRGSPSGRAKVGIIGTTARWLAPLVFEQLAISAPKVDLTVADGSSHSLLRRLEDGELDLAVVGLPLDEADTLIRPLFSEDYTLIVPAGHPLSTGPDPLPATMVAQHPILVPPKMTAFRREVDAWFREHDATANVQSEIDGLRLLTSLCFAGYGPGIVPATAVPGWIEGNWEHRRLDGIGRRQVVLSRRRRGLPSVAARAASAAIMATVASKGPEVTGVHVAGSDQP